LLNQGCSLFNEYSRRQIGPMSPIGRHPGATVLMVREKDDQLIYVILLPGEFLRFPRDIVSNILFSFGQKFACQVADVGIIVGSQFLQFCVDFSVAGKVVGLNKAIDEV
jgi:hypothetical protein